MTSNGVEDNSQTALNVKICELLNDISEDRLLLPSFQRQSSWGLPRIKNFLKAVYEKNTLGVLLQTHYDGRQHSKTLLEARRFDGIKEGENIVYPAPNRLLLDGQQRLTALWKVFNDGDDDNLFCIQFEKKANGTYFIHEKEPIVSLPKKGKKVNEEDSYKRFYLKKTKKIIPLYFFTPQQSQKDWDDRCDKWLKNFKEGLTKKNYKKDWKEKKVQYESYITLEKNKLKNLLDDTKNRFFNSNMAYFLLPSTINAREATKIFMDINTGSAQLTSYDIVVADIDGETGKYIEDTIAKSMKTKVSDIEDFDKFTAGELAIKISCLLNDMSPSGANYTKLKPYKKEIFDNKIRIIDGVDWAVKTLKRLKIYGGKQLPSVVPLRVLPALYSNYIKYIKSGKATEQSQKEKDALKIINRYIWHAFLSERYEKRADTLLKEDYLKLSECFKESLNSKNIKEIPIIRDYKETEIISAGWPKKGGILARGILQTCLQLGGKDPISGIALDENNVQGRNYHHIFPESILKNIEGANPNLALNCLFISMQSNGKFDNDLPGTYLKALWENSKIKKIETQNYFDTHLIDKDLFDYLVKIDDQRYKNAGGKINESKLLNAYNDFIEKRAQLVKNKINKLLKTGEF